MVRTILLAMVGLASCVSWPSRVMAQVTVVREGSEVVLRSLSKYLGKSTSKEALEAIAEYGGEATVRRLAQRAMQEGGEATLEKLASASAKYGPETLRAFDNVGKMGPILQSLDELPEASVASALRRLGAGTAGRELAEATETLGVRAIQAELKHPGIGTGLVRSLGDDGVRLAESLSKEEALTLARHAQDISALPLPQRTKVMELLYRDTQGMVKFMGRFIEKHPGKSLFAGATTAVVLAEADRVLGGDEIVFDAEGNPHLMSKPGLAGRVTEQAAQSVVRPLMGYLVPLVAVAVGAWFSIKLWGSYWRTRISLDRKRKS